MLVTDDTFDVYVEPFNFNGMREYPVIALIGDRGSRNYFLSQYVAQAKMEMDFYCKNDSPNFDFLYQLSTSSFSAICLNLSSDNHDKRDHHSNLKDIYLRQKMFYPNIVVIDDLNLNGSSNEMYFKKFLDFHYICQSTLILCVDIEYDLTLPTRIYPHINYTFFNLTQHINLNGLKNHFHYYDYFADPTLNNANDRFKLFTQIYQVLSQTNSSRPEFLAFDRNGYSGGFTSHVFHFHFE